MQRMRSVSALMGLFLTLFLLAGTRQTAHADLIRATPGRSFPDIAGDIGGSQTYVYDPATQTGTFALVNAPHLISLGPSVNDLIPMEPNSDGTLYQSLKLKLDRNGRLVDSPLNKFEIHGSVIINDQVYEGLLLEGTPTAFGIAEHDRPAMNAPDVFGLNMRIERGLLASTFGSEAYLRIIPQSNSTFTGQFTCDFSGEKPMTNLLAVDRRTSYSDLVRPAMIGLILGAASLMAWPIARSLTRSWRRRPVPRDRPLSRWASPAC
jgi:hypothetical protein